MKKNLPSVTLTGSATARVLKVTRQAVSDAVYRYALIAKGKPGQWRFSLEDVVWYAVQTRRSLDEIVEGIQKELSVEWLWAATFVLRVLGLESVVKQLDPEDTGFTPRAARSRK